MVSLFPKLTTLRIRDLHIILYSCLQSVWTWLSILVFCQPKDMLRLFLCHSSIVSQQMVFHFELACSSDFDQELVLFVLTFLIKLLFFIIDSSQVCYRMISLKNFEKKYRNSLEFTELLWKFFLKDGCLYLFFNLGWYFLCVEIHRKFFAKQNESFIVIINN